MEALFFYLFAGLTLISALLVITSKQPVYCVLYLLVAMFCLAALFVMLGAYFVAALQVLLYAGAVLVLFLFVIMLLNLDRDTLTRAKSFTFRGAGIFTALVLAAAMVRLLMQAVMPARAPAAQDAGTVATLGHLLFTTYLLPFELTSFLILAAIVGAVTLARAKE